MIFNNSMAMKKDPSIGSELNRIKKIHEYDEKEFNQLYKLVLPYIKRLSRNIDARRLSVSSDLIESYFMDKFLFIFNKYHSIYEYEQLKANILTGLKKYSYRLMRDGYTQRSEFNQQLVSFEDLFDDSKEDFDIIEEGSELDILSHILQNFMEERLTPDEYLVWRITLDPPPFILNLMKKSNGKLSISHLIDFFEFPRDRASYKHFSLMFRKFKTLKEEAIIKFN